MDVYQQIFFSTLALAFGMLHGILYFYNRRLRSNLYFAIFAVLYAANVFLDFQSILSDTSNDHLFYLRWHRAVIPFVMISALLFIYSLLELPTPRHFWIIATALILAGAYAVIDPDRNYFFLQILFIVVLIEIVHYLLKGVRSQQAGIWIIFVGMIINFTFAIYDWLVDFNVIEMIAGIHNGSVWGFIGLIFSTSIYLSQDFARTNERMLSRERENTDLELKRKLLAAEDARKSKELEDARKLQLSMLPHCLNDIPGYDICFHMKPASEVGGDYYDYHVHEDGTLTIAVGDATGHGMKAGIMVSIIKSLFIALGRDSEVLNFFQQSTETIKQMGLKQIYMALMMLRIKDNKLCSSAAGMPPFYIYRAQTDTVEAVTIKGMPLGAFNDFPYKTFETELAPGDALLIMSDGLQELFNEAGEMLDETRIRETFQAAAAKKPAGDIVRDLIQLGEDWRQTRSPDDDVTLVVVKMSR